MEYIKIRKPDWEEGKYKFEQLQEENKKLHDIINELEERNKQLLSQCDAEGQYSSMQYDEILGLKSENKKLHDITNEIEDEKTAGQIKEKDELIQTQSKYIKQLKEGIKRLQAQNVCTWCGQTLDGYKPEDEPVCPQCGSKDTLIVIGGQFSTECKNCHHRFNKEK